MSKRTTIGAMLVFDCPCIYRVFGRIAGKYEPYIYVGMADRMSVAQRMTQHLTGNERGTQKFGELLRAHQNASAEDGPSQKWKVEVLTIEECCENLRKCWGKLPLAKKLPKNPSLHDVEEAMIEEYHPIANSQHNKRKRA